MPGQGHIRLPRNPYTCLSAVLDPLVRCSHPERHCCIAVGVRGSTARRYWSDSVSSWTGTTPLLPSSTLLDPSSFVNSPPVLIRSILRHASRLSPPTHAESFHKHNSGAKLCRSAAVRLPLLQHVPLTRHGERYYTWPASMRGISARHRQNAQLTLPISITPTRFFTAPSSHPCPIETTPSWPILNAHSQTLTSSTTPQS